MKRLVGAALAGLALGAAPAAAWQVRVLDVVALPPAWRAHELSGLAWVAEEAALFAVSDRGRLWRLPVRVERGPDGERLRLGEVAAAVDLPATAAGKRPNAEALAWRPPGAGAPHGVLIVADEGSPAALVIDPQGRLHGTRPLPGPADQHARLRGANAGIEALAWHPVHGLLAVPQRPLRGEDPQVHRIHAADGRRWALLGSAEPGGRAGRDGTKGGPSAVKAIELPTPDTLLVLERVGAGKSLQAVLRPLSLTGCAGAAPCDPPALRLEDPRLGGRDNFEGLACLGADRCILVSDDGGAPKGRTLLVLVALTR